MTTEKEIFQLLRLADRPVGWDKFVDKWLKSNYEPQYQIEIRDDIQYTIFADQDYKYITSMAADVLKRNVWSYSTKKGYTSISEQEWNKIQSQEKSKQKLEEKKANFESKYLNLAEISIKTGIWKYLNITPEEEKIIRFFWTMLITSHADQWRMNLKGDIYIDDELYNTLINAYGETAEWFLQKGFLSQGVTGERQFIRGQVQVDNEERGIYGIYYEGKCVYIGLCLQRFADERKVHQEILKGLKDVPTGMEFYKKIKDESKVEFKVLFNAAKAQTKKLLSVEHLEAIHLALITIMQPVGNVQGRLQNYVFKAEFGKEN